MGACYGSGGVMAQLTIWHGIAIEGSRLVPEGKHILWRHGQPIWCGPIGAPIEDVEFDRITVNPADYERVVLATMEGKSK
jgi:hypothetical protein